MGNDLNAELSRVVSELETAIGERRKMAVDSQSDAADPAATDNESIEEKTMQVGLLLFGTASRWRHRQREHRE